MHNLCPVCQFPKKHSIEKPTMPSLWSRTCGQKSCIKILTQQTNLEQFGHISNLHRKLENGNTVLQETMLNKYQVFNVSQIDSVKQKKQETCLENFGVPWPMQSALVKQKSVETVLEKYGVTNVSKSPSVIAKIKQTQIDKYGCYFMQTSEGKELLKNICREKYGVDWYFNSEHFKTQLEARNLELFGVTNPFYSSVVQSQIAKRNGKGKSKEETKWLDSLCIDETFRQYPITGKSGKTYMVDGFDPITNTVYEWNGSFWHGNPDYYDSHISHPVKKNKTFGELYEQTVAREQDMLDAGYELIAKWSVL